MDDDKFEEIIMHVSKLNCDSIRNIIESFSCYLNCSNPDYHYNESYLPSFVEEYYNFSLIFIKKKLQIDKINYLQFIFKIGIEELIIDNYWCYDFNNQLLRTTGSKNLKSISRNPNKFEIKCIGTINNELVTYVFETGARAKNVENMLTKLQKIINK